MANYQSTHTGAQIDEGVDKANKALVKPDSAPSATSLLPSTIRTHRQRLQSATVLVLKMEL